MSDLQLVDKAESVECDVQTIELQTSDTTVEMIEYMNHNEPDNIILAALQNAGADVSDATQESLGECAEDKDSDKTEITNTGEVESKAEKAAKTVDSTRNLNKFTGDIVLKTEEQEPILLCRVELEQQFRQCPECGISCNTDWNEVVGEHVFVGYKCVAGHSGQTLNLHQLKFVKGLMNAGK